MWPPLPPWNAIHPLVVHIPIGLFAVVPVVLLLGLIVPTKRDGIFLAALTVMVVGVIGAFVAVFSGSAAEEAAERIASARVALERHEELAETARTIFAVLTALFAALLIAARLLPNKLKPGHVTAATVVLLAVWVGSTSFLARAAHEGGRLVHEFGVQAPIAPTAATSSAIPRVADHDD